MMSRKKSSGWTLVKALYVLPIAAFAAIAFANCSKTESESTQNYDTQDKLPEVLFNQVLNDFGGAIPEGGVMVWTADENGKQKLSRVTPDGILHELTKEEAEEMKLPMESFAKPLKNRKISKDDVFFVVEDMPEYPGGELELRKFIAENVKYPEEAKTNKLQGKVFVQFVVDTNGDVTDAEIVRGTGYESLDNEALRVVKTLPQWKPGKQRGQNVPVSYTVPINFQLN